MRVKVGTATNLRLKSGRPFSTPRPGEVDLDRIGLTKAEQEELLEMHWIVPADAELDATDAARELAKENEIDLVNVKGTGADGRITINDVRALVEDDEDDESEENGS